MVVPRVRISKGNSVLSNAHWKGMNRNRHRKKNNKSKRGNLPAMLYCADVPQQHSTHKHTHKQPITNNCRCGNGNVPLYAFAEQIIISNLFLCFVSFFFGFFSSFLCSIRVFSVWPFVCIFILWSLLSLCCACVFGLR